MGKPLDPVCYRTPRKPRNQRKMAATSINIQPVKTGSEAHNLRQKELDYVNKELTYMNESISQDAIANRLAEIKTRYTETTGQQMQKKSTPIREGVIVIQDKTEMWILENFALACKNKFVIRAFQIHMHMDEGHRDLITQEWKPNLHAHMVFDWTDPKTGKSIKLNRQDMAELQTLCADCLGMERGVSSDKQHLNAVQFKTLEVEKTITQVSALVETQESTLERLKIESDELQSKQIISKTVSKVGEKIGDIIGMTKNDKEKEGLKTQINTLEAQIKTYGRKISFQEQLLGEQQRDLEKEKHLHNDLKARFETMRRKLEQITMEVGVLANSIPGTWKEWIQKNLPYVARAMSDQKGNYDQDQKLHR